MSTHKLAPALWKKNRDKIIRMYSALLAGSFVFGTAIAARPWIKDVDNIRPFLLSTIAPACFFTVAGTLLVWCMVRGARTRYFSYQLTLDDNGIVRAQTGVPVVSIPRGEMTRFQEITGKGAMLKTSDASQFLWLPDEIEGYEQVLNRIAEWVPREAAQKTMPGINNPWATLPICFISILLIFSISVPWIVTVVAFLFTGFLLYHIVYAIRNPNISRGMALYILIGVSISVALVVRHVLTVWTPASMR